MFGDVVRPPEKPAARRAREKLSPRMRVHVSLEVALLLECLCALAAVESRRDGVSVPVPGHSLGVGVGLAADAAFEGTQVEVDGVPVVVQQEGFVKGFVAQLTVTVPFRGTGQPASGAGRGTLLPEHQGVGAIPGGRGGGGGGPWRGRARGPRGEGGRGPGGGQRRLRARCPRPWTWGQR